MIKVGITGTIGSGKSTVTRLLATLGYRTLDSDEIVKQRVLTAPEVVGALRDRYGSEVLGADGGVDRPYLARRVFSDAQELRWLENLVHPKIFSAWTEAFAETPGARWAVEVPLLFEKRLENWFDFTVCVALSRHEQLVRLEQRGLSRELAGRRISQQLPQERKVELADFVVWNEGSPEHLEAQVKFVVQVLAAC